VSKKGGRLRSEPKIHAKRRAEGSLQQLALGNQGNSHLPSVPNSRDGREEHEGLQKRKRRFYFIFKIEI